MRKGVPLVAEMGNTTLGFSWGDVTNALQSGAVNAAGSFISSASAAPLVQAGQQQALATPLLTVGGLQKNWKIIAGVTVAIFVVAAFVISRKK
jgi:hypothetical protein